MKKRFLIDRDVTGAGGTQTFYVDAASEEEALEMHREGKSEIYSDNCEVLDLGEPYLVGTTGLDDFGDFSALTSPPAVQTAVPSDSDLIGRAKRLIADLSATNDDRQIMTLAGRMDQLLHEIIAGAALTSPSAAPADEEDGTVTLTRTQLENFRARTVAETVAKYAESRAAAPLSDDSRKLVDEALARVQELGTIGAMKWLARALSRTAPPGWKLVPTEPTLQMAKAFRDADANRDQFILGYRAMLAASPLSDQEQK